MPKRLTEKQKKFCEVYAGNGGNATDAAKEAGYKKPNKQGSQNLAKLGIQEYIKELTEKIKSERIAIAVERQEFWTRVMRGEETTTAIDKNGNAIQLNPEMKDRLKASEILGKAQGDFIERLDHTSTDGSMSRYKNMSDEEIDSRIAELQEKLIMDD